MNTRGMRLALLALLGVAVSLGLAGDARAQIGADPLPDINPAALPQFVNPLPNPLDNVLVPDTTTYPGYDYYHISMLQVRQNLGVVDATGAPLTTKVWGYNGFYPGPTIEARKGRPVKVFYTNDLFDSAGNPLPHLLPLDTTLNCGMDVYGQNSYCRPFVRTVAHLHGGHVADTSDGNPEAWFSAGFADVGPGWTRTLYDYANDQQATTLWYHDHAMGITRLNVYAGLAGFYLLRDTTEDRLQTSGYLPRYPYEIPMVIQDRSFKTNGNLSYPNDPWKDANGNVLSLDPITGQPVPSIQPEFFAKVILVNGQTWPVLQVEPRKYRIRLLNGSDSRFYHLYLSKTLPAVPIWQIGTDGGFLRVPVAITSLLLAPAERADLIIDFSAPGLTGQTIILNNDAATPYPTGSAPNPATTGRVMAFKVTRPLNKLVPDTTIPTKLVDLPALTPTPGVPTREVLLAEVTDSIGRIQPLLGTSAKGPLHYDDPITEKPKVGTTEIWSIINTTTDSHPVHLHLVQFQILDRQAFDTTTYIPGQPSTLTLLGTPKLPDPNEKGWKDTVRANPGEVTRVIAKFDLTGLYVWHCHILEHEDHEMMRPLKVVP
jgi:spore coat protein A